MGKRLFIGQRCRILLFHHALVTENNLYPSTFLSTRFVGKNHIFVLSFESILQEGSCCGAGDCHQTAKKKTLGLFFFIMHSMPQGARAGYYGREKKNRGKIHRAWRRNESCGCVREKRYCLYYACCLLTFHLFLGFSVHSFDSFTTRRFAVFFISLDWYFESMPHSVLSSFSSSSFSTLISQLVFISAREK